MFRPSLCLTDLRRHASSRVALIEGDTVLTYGALADRIETMVDALGPDRRLVLVGGGNHIDALVGHLAALAGGHAVILVPPEHRSFVDDLLARYDPDVTFLPDPAAEGGWRLRERRPGSVHRLHPDLALMLTTSGSTGSPKLVRLSRQAVDANAASIVEYLGITADDRAITTLPMHYSYGLSVLHSHLLAGASLVLTEASVIDAEFWSLMRTHAVTSLAGVPYTYELLERSGFEDADLPSLRTLTQAGGRLGPERVLRFATLAARRGMRFFVMYGQTEATARMAYLPPDLALAHPESIGVAIPGGHFDLEPVDEDLTAQGIGELVYRGPNVMMGYAESAADLASGPELEALRTGDLARRDEAGVYVITGRKARFAKAFGLRVDLARVESALEAAGVRAAVAGRGDGLGIVAVRPCDASRVREIVAGFTDLPATSLHVVEADDLPRLPTGKVDNAAVARLVEAGDQTPAPPAGSDVTSLCALYDEALGVHDIRPEDTFVDRGGDSMSFVALSIRLEGALGDLPPDWPTRTVADLAAHAQAGVRGGRLLAGWRRFETTAVLRAAGILAMLTSHLLFPIQGGGHILLAASGYSFARFQLAGRPRPGRLVRVAFRIALPSAAFILLAKVTSSAYQWSNVVLVRTFLDPDLDWGSWYDYWYIEVTLALLLGLAALLAVPGSRAALRRYPFGVPLVLTVIGLLPAWGVGPWRQEQTPEVLLPDVAWLFFLGWAAARASARWQKALLTILVGAGMYDFFPERYHDEVREVLIVLGCSLLIWAATVRAPAIAARPIEWIAGGSLYIYVVHWGVITWIDPHGPVERLLTFALSIAAGLAYGALWQRLLPRIESWFGPRPSASVEAEPLRVPERL